MVVTDPIADLLTRIRNALTAKHEVVTVPTSKMKKSITDILVNEGFIKSAEVVETEGHSNIVITLKYGKKNEKVEASGTFGSLTFAGFGTFENGRVKAIAGGLAGLWTATPDCTLSFSRPQGSEQAEEFGYCLAYSICPVLAPVQVEDVTVTAAYGTFKVKYNAKKSKKLAASRSAMFGAVVPKAVFKYYITDAYQVAQ